MKIQVFSPSGDFIDTTNEITPSEIEQLYGSCADIDDEDYDNEISEFDIMTVYYHVASCKDDHKDALTKMVFACFVFWSANDEIKNTFEKNSLTKDGFVKIGLDGLEVGWKDRRYH